MGGPAASHDNFWQLFVRPAGTSKWHLVTPPGVASNGGLVIAGLGAGPVVAGFRPSQDLSYSPLATTHDNGTAWTPGLLDAGLADVPDALAAAPRQRPPARAAEQRRGRAVRPRRHRPGRNWPPAPGSRRARGGHPVPAGQPHRSGVQPIRGSHAGDDLRPPRHRRRLRLRQRPWHPAGPALPGSYAHQRHRAPAHHRPAAATTARCSRRAPAQRHACSAAWPPTAAPTGPCPSRCRCTARGSNPRHSGPAARPRSCLTGTGRNLTGRRPSWRPLPALPPGTATLAQARRGWDALAVHRSRLTVWRLAPAVPRGPPRRPSTSPSSSGHRADAGPARRIFFTSAGHRTTTTIAPMAVSSEGCPRPDRPRC